MLAEGNAMCRKVVGRVWYEYIGKHMRQSESRVRSNQSHAPNQIKPTYAKQEGRRASKQTHRQNTRLFENARGHNETKEKRGGEDKRKS